ncbi:MAG TPA: retropepsin-like aspartic protease [Candidatus Eremiobacteraceae bacterium]|nr:retropepsin-like aspartic protease [Candidatus Eremiobacteraceae bacterium]
MTWKSRFFRVLLALAVAVIVPAARAASKADTGSTNYQLPIDIYHGYLIVAPVDVGELHGLRFLLDTGCTNTVIDRRVAKRLGLAARRAKVLNFDKLIAVESSELPEITFGPEQANNLRVLIEDLRYIQTGEAPVDGIIGLDLLRRRNFLVDYAAARIVFDAAETTDMQAVPMRVSSTTLAVAAQLDGRPVWMIADTGLLRTMIYERGLETVLENYRVQGHVLSQSTGGWVQNRVSMVLQFRLGAQDLGHEVLFVSAPPANRLADVAGYLGPASLKAKQVMFDFDAHQLRWKP